MARSRHTWAAGGGFFNPFNMDIKQIANTNVLHWAGRIFALHEVSFKPCSPCGSVSFAMVCLVNGDHYPLHLPAKQLFRSLHRPGMRRCTNYGGLGYCMRMHSVVDVKAVQQG